MNLSSESLVAQIAVSHPVSLRVFHRRSIDFCCRGKRTLASACATLGLDTNVVLGEIAAEEQAIVHVPIDWSQRTKGELIDHVLRRYHEPLREELLRLEGMAAKVLHVHGAKDPERLSRLVVVLGALADELLAHLQKEELTLFPRLRAGLVAPASLPISVMEREHEEVGRMLEEIVQLTDRFVPPPGACGTWRGLWQGLALFDEDLREHIHLENNVLFAA